ncbi:hypothetical protein CL1_0515 [Thermococcus cleftensis]|uniref:Uncharacterized protein n=1 Tax=Thermococcus cleftensis (strain DSM 27260 / KACC 17922 / CL1) TaxID=163003 RepID=I3ZSN9_THECF|nr:hypothetical protein [Thermococcus cleftensis]AFL94723.1 hypothetical protein CL1_0515 [Thermococcus cleftensis]
MNGVNLIDFTMPSPVPAPAGGKAKTRNLGGMKLVLPRKKPEQTEVEKEEQVRRRNWWKALLPLLGIIIVIKLATWYARRYGK